MHFSLYPLGMKLQFYLRLQDLLQQNQMASKYKGMCREHHFGHQCVDVSIKSKR